MTDPEKIKRELSQLDVKDLVDILEKVGRGALPKLDEEFIKESAKQYPCCVYLSDDGNTPNGIWSWRVYIDGSIQTRFPGYTRKTERKLYDRLEKGEHRIVIRESDHRKLDRLESNTIYFVVEDQNELDFKVTFIDEKIGIERIG